MTGRQQQQQAIERATATDLAPVAPGVEEARLALWAGVFGDAPRQEALMAVALCARYDLDPVLRHVVVFQEHRGGRWALMLSRDALIHVAHRSGQFDGMDVEEAQLVDDPVTGGRQWVTKATVYRKDWNHPVTMPGRYPFERRVRTADGGYRQEAHPYGPEMAIKRAEARALRRAFAIALGGAGMYVEGDEVVGEAEVVVDEDAPDFAHDPETGERIQVPAPAGR